MKINLFLFQCCILIVSALNANAVSNMVFVSGNKFIPHHIDPSHQFNSIQTEPLYYYFGEVQEEGGGISSADIKFGMQENRLSNDAKSILGRLAVTMKDQPATKAIVKGHGSGDKYITELVLDRVFNIIDYMVDKYQIDRSRFSYIMEDFGDTESVYFNIEGARP